MLRPPDGSLVLRERRRPLGDLATAQDHLPDREDTDDALPGDRGTYNRIEGLPIVFGPIFELRPTRFAARLDLRGILRTAGEGVTVLPATSATRRGRSFGWQRGHRGPGLQRGGIHRGSAPLSGGERLVGLSAAAGLPRLFRAARRGGVHLGAAGAPFRLELSLQRDHERSVRATDPWSLLRNSDRWRRNPLIDDGHYSPPDSISTYDTRNQRDLPSTGWPCRADTSTARATTCHPHVLPDVIRPPVPAGGGYGFDRLSLDLRRYSRLTPSLRVNGRLRADGWVGGDRLPVQRRVSLGGPDLLPGYDFRAFTCAPRGFSDPSDPALCDRMIAAQVEVRTRLGLNLGYRTRGKAAGSNGRFIGIEEADLVFLGDVGKSWLAGDGPGQVPAGRIPSFDEWKVDVGVGLDAGEIGAYLAKGLSGGGPIKFLVRLQRRF